MAIRNDYLLDMIKQFADAITVTATKDKGGLSKDAVDVYEECVGKVLDMPAEAVLDLSPASLVTMMQISATSQELAVYVVYFLQRMADAAAGGDDGTASLRRDQAVAVAEAYGLSPDAIPPELLEGSGEGLR